MTVPTSGSLANPGFSATLADLVRIVAKLPAVPPGTPSPTTDFTSLVPALLSDIGDLAADASGVPAASTALAKFAPILAPLQTAAASGTPITDTAGSYAIVMQVAELALGAAIILAATNLAQSLARAMPCAPEVQALQDFQTAYASQNPSFNVSGVYDAATAAAMVSVGVTPPCAPTNAPGYVPAVPAPSGGITTTQVVGGVVAVGSLGLLGWLLFG